MDARKTRTFDPSWLVLRAQAGDREALERLLVHVQDLLRPFLSAMIRDEDLRADVLQETLLLVYRKLAGLLEPRAFSGWVRRIASREVFRALRRTRREEQLHEELPPDLPADADPPTRELLERLPGLLEHASAASRAVLALHYLEGLTLEEVAAVLDLPVGTAKSRLSYGLAALRRTLTEEEPAR